MLDPKLFLKLLQLDLNAHPPGAPILKIHLAAEPARPRSAQGGLFLPPTPEPEKLELTLARIAGLVGESCVGSLELLDTHRAESFRMRRFAPGRHKKKQYQKLPMRKINPPVAALRMFRPPLRATVTMENGELATWGVQRKKKCRAMFSGRPAPGALPATGGTGKPGRAMNGISLCKMQRVSLSTVWCTICSAEAGSWKARMTESKNF